MLTWCGLEDEELKCQMALISSQDSFYAALEIIEIGQCLWQLRQIGLVLEPFLLLVDPTD